MRFWSPTPGTSTRNGTRPDGGRLRRDEGEVRIRLRGLPMCPPRRPDRPVVYRAAESGAYKDVELAAHELLQLARPHQRLNPTLRGSFAWSAGHPWFVATGNGAVQLPRVSPP